MKKHLIFLIDIYNTLKPKYYNKITSFLIFIGASSFTMPWWIDYLNVLILHFTDYEIRENPLDMLFGFALICVALIWNYKNRELDLKHSNNN